MAKTIETTGALDICSFEWVENCAKMPCDHGMTKDSLLAYSLSQYEHGEQCIKCPHLIGKNQNEICGEKWKHSFIIKVLLSEFDNLNTLVKIKDIIQLNLKCSSNALKSSESYDTQQCPQCLSLIFRNIKENENGNRTNCPFCPSKYSFCWGCCAEWKDESSPYCSNSDCPTAFLSQTIDILHKCDTKNIGSQKNCPTIRACPNCSQLINHTDACKHMDCTSCKKSFCFVCLKMKKNGNWQCGGHSDVCPVAPRQDVKILNFDNKLKL